MVTEPSSRHQSAFSEARIGLASDDDMVMHWHSHELARFNKLLRDPDVFATWS